MTKKAFIPIRSTSDETGDCVQKGSREISHNNSMTTNKTAPASVRTTIKTTLFMAQVILTLWSTLLRTNRFSCR
jgi:hypothetical protein